jgi:hypothetical protein
MSSMPCLTVIVPSSIVTSNPFTECACQFRRIYLTVVDYGLCSGLWQQCGNAHPVASHRGAHSHAETKTEAPDHLVSDRAPAASTAVLDGFLGGLLLD